MDERGPTTIVKIGPEVVDRLPDLVQVEITVQGEPPLPAIRWPTLTPSPLPTSLPILDPQPVRTPEIEIAGSQRDGRGRSGDPHQERLRRDELAQQLEEWAGQQQAKLD